eukprot:CAMPEP_0181464604 /NCGR_PEP_ID=MMETSP1110-20121109/35519_1 /TAXON_ID=174948 /ORGANISM="Symbiodinium sp., Strain CCMP421" /LENGTH=99 /DNA_ID=CAMNT_0023589345 /DNA_START=248 /DNA_END=547 /DNA_ORIENTATION=-
MSAHNLVQILGPDEVTHLRTGVNARQRHVVDGVPETDAPVCRPASRGQQPVLVRGPRNCLHGCLVAIKLQHRLGGFQRPNAELVVIPPGGQLLLVEGPL